MAPPVELQRWLLETRGIAHEFVARAPGLHAFASRRHGMPIELPLILTPAGPVGSLWSSIEWLEEILPARESLFPDPGDRAFVQWLCAELFSPAVKSFYSRMLLAPRLLVPVTTVGTPWYDRLFVRLAFPVWRAMMRAGLGLNTFDPDDAAARIDAVFDRIDSELSGAPFLHGRSAGIRDLVFAVLASPIILPERHPVRLPSVGELPDGLRQLVVRCRARPAGVLALRMYEARPPVRDHGRVPADRPGVAARLVTPRVVRLAARAFAAIGPRTLLIRKSLFVGRWRDVDEALRRDSDFLIAPINAERITGVMGPFILGMDASPALHSQRESLYAALREADREAVGAILAAEPQRLAGDAARRFGRIDAVNGYARPIAARVAAAWFGISGPTEQDLMRVARAVFQETFLNLGNDAAVQARGRAAGAELAGWIEQELARRGTQTRRDLLGRLAAQVREGRLAREQVPWIASGLLVGAIDTTATVVANILAEAVADERLMKAMHRDRADGRLLSGWCWEALRRRPHNPLLLREARADTVLAGRPVPAGTRIWALTLAAMQDERAFPKPAALDPRRSGELYMHFGYGLHRCSGRELNAVQIPTLVRTLLDHGVRGPAESRSRGPFPDRLVVTLESRP